MKMGIRQNWQEPSDSEIESDVAELRRLLDGIEGPREPHPAYFQNFLVHTRQRIDEQQARRSRFSPSVAWASLSAAALAVILVVGGVLPSANTGSITGRSGKEIASAQQPILSTQDGNDILGLEGVDSDLSASMSIGAQPAVDESTSILLSSDDVKMINAIMSEQDDDAILDAMIETGGSL